MHASCNNRVLIIYKRLICNDSFTNPSNEIVLTRKGNKSRKGLLSSCVWKKKKKKLKKLAEENQFSQIVIVHFCLPAVCVWGWSQIPTLWSPPQAEERMDRPSPNPRREYWLHQERIHCKSEWTFVCCIICLHKHYCIINVQANKFYNNVPFVNIMC